MKLIKKLTQPVKKVDLLIVLILSLGLLYRILVTSGGNFVFHVDNARDMLQVREIVVLHRLPLIGPATGINGLFTGPLWFYILAVPFVLSGGNPYANIILMNLFWFVGGYVLLLIMKNRGKAAFVASAALWIGSNYLLLDSVYAFNPNPIAFLIPIYIYGLAKYLETGKFKFALLVGVLSAMYWNLETAFGSVVPLVILISLVLTGKIKLLKSKNFWLGIVIPELIGVLPQIIFELRHNFFMSRSVLGYIVDQKSLHSTFIFSDRVRNVWLLFAEGFRGTFMNQPVLIYLAILIFIIFLITQFKKNIVKDYLLQVTLILSIAPFIIFTIIPLAIQRWHVDASLACLILLLGFSLGYLEKIKEFKFNKRVVWASVVVIVCFAIMNLHIPDSFNQSRPIDDPSMFKNQIAAIDYVYKQAGGKNFKAYVYSPGILDLPYQYNFWWYGQNTKYGYLPQDYAYLPNEPEYVLFKNRYSNGKNPPDSGLVMLIKESGFPAREDLWKNNFSSLQLLKSEMVGPFKIEVRKE